MQRVVLTNVSPIFKATRFTSDVLKILPGLLKNLGLYGRDTFFKPYWVDLPNYIKLSKT